MRRRAFAGMLIVSFQSGQRVTDTKLYVLNHSAYKKKLEKFRLFAQIPTRDFAGGLPGRGLNK